MKIKTHKIIIFKHSLVVILTLLFAFINIGFFVKDTQAVLNPIDPGKYVDFDGTFNWETNIIDQSLSTNYISYTEYRSSICTVSSGTCDTDKIIRFDTAEELYRFSVDVSFEEVYITGNPTEDVKLSDDKINQILDQHYVLGRDIDYSVMKSKTFIPIGYIFGDLNPTERSYYQRYFTGIFDGQGFEIKNLYMSGYEYLIYVDNSNPETIDIAMTEYYGMFNYNAGVIKNIGFVDMYTELLQMNPELTKLTNVVGFNMPDPKTWDGEDFTKYGSVENIYVIDNRTSVTEAGIRYLVGTSSEDFTASGIVHTNAGNFENSYYVSQVVVNANFINKFTIQPVLFSNTGSVIINLGEVNQDVITVTGLSSNLVYDSTKYLFGDVDVDEDNIIDFTVEEPNSLLASGISTSDIKNGIFTYNANTWYFYPQDGYPILKGLIYSGGVYEIWDAIDLAFFSRLLNKNSVLNDLPFTNSNYVLKANIDMSILSPGSYQVPTKVFHGSFSGANGSEELLSDNFYIYGLVINGGYSYNNEHFAGLFSRLGSGAVVKDLIFSQSQINLTNTNTIYSQTFYVGAIAGQMTNSTVENVLLDVDLNLGTEALSTTYLGGAIGKGSGIINQVSNSADIDFGTHSFTSSQAVNSYYYTGGIIGSSNVDSPIYIYDTVNKGDIYGFATTSDIVLPTGVDSINVYIGGVIGHIQNTEVVIHNLVSVANKGDIYIGSVKETTVAEAYQYIGGVFGALEGKAPVLEDEFGYRFANLYNEGDLISEYGYETARITSAGIGVSNTTENVEYALLYNHGNFNQDLTNFPQVDYSTDLFISEYGEGYNYNRWIEIYNGTAETVNLSGYSYKVGLNGGTWSYEFDLSGYLNPGETHVVSDVDASPEALAKTDLENPWWRFDGNDSVGLFKNDVLIDIFGVYREDPGTGWTVDGVTNATRDHVLVRKSSSYQPTTTWNTSDWIVYPSDDVSYLGFHEIDRCDDVNHYLLDYSATIFEISENEIEVTLTRAYNYANFTFDSPVYQDISPFYYSNNNNLTNIRYSANHGNIYFWSSAGNEQIKTTGETNISAITLNTNVNYLTVHNNGQITVVNVDIDSFPIYISGFTKYLSLDRYIKNSVNDGNITFADITGSGNIYVSGLVNYNNSGDLQDENQSPTQPIATEGIINTVNSGNISTTYSSTKYGVDGLSNTFVGGLSTLNKGSIQDSTNLGDISLVNTNTQGVTNFSPSTASAYEGGLIIDYTTGIAAGGVSAIVLDGNSRIFDSSNNGNILVKTYRFSRAGGILGVSLWKEAYAGGITSSMGLVDNIQNSKLANGLNFGDVSALTNVIEEYSLTPVTRDLNLVIGDNPSINYYSSDRLVPLYYTDTMGSEQRLPVYAVAGGVIGYGLSYMNNMLNHGTISSTDVAGGVVGATYVLGGSTGPETIVNITTAVNYGEIKSIPTGSFDSDINSVNLILNNELTIESVSNQYMVDGNPYIFPSGYTREGPRGKRGFGGIFGRLQRGNLGTMTAAGGSFNFIVNANPNIDLIGRIDQVGDFSNTVTAYQFNGAIYYSANRNDTTQVVFTGFNYTTEYSYNGNYRDNVYQIIDVNYLGYTQEGSNYNHEYYIIGQYYNGHSQQGIINDPETVYAYIDEVVVSSSSSEPGSSYFVGQTLYNDNDDQYYYVGGRRIPWITEDPNDFYITDITNQFMYDSGFPMRENSNLTKYIYYAEYNLLANRFRELGHDNDGTGENTRLNGMYVLATTAGQEFGAVLPRNINPESMELINEDVNLSIINLDYDNLNLAPSETVNLSDEVLLKYEDLYQTRYNNKADLTESTLQNITLHENPGGSNTSLSLPNIDYETKKITFSVSMEAFSSTQESVSYNIFDALTSANALIADRLQDFRIDDLIFTEYIEGSGNNQAIEIYNGTGDSIDLSLYSIALYLGSSTTMAGSISLSGTLLDGDTYVIANSSASAQILAVADLTSVYVSYLTGDDKIVLNKGATVIDSIGKVGDSSSYAQDVTLTRKLMKRDVSTSDTYEVDYYWESHSIDTFSYLGDYTFGLSDLSLLLYYERYDEISTDYPALLEVDLPDYQTPIDVNLFIGSFSIYSEAFINNTLFASSEYFNDYDIYITFTPNMANTSGTTGIRYIAFNGGSNIALSTTTEFINPQPSSLNITARGDVNYNGSLKLIFNDEKDALNEGYDFKDNFVLYYMSGTNEVEVDLEYYSVTSVPQTSAGVYEITFDFSNALIKTGNYRIKYKYFSGSSNTYEVNFDKSASSESTIYDLDYYSYDEEFVPTGTNFTTQINMGKIPNINGNTNNFTPITIDPLNPLYREYLSNTSYNISFMNSDSFIISDFAVVTRAQLRTDLTSYSNGYITYVIEYDIEAENGTPQTYTHSITERAVSLNAVYKDGNDVALDNITTTREANSTQFAVDLEFDQTVSMSGPVVYTLDNELSSYLTINVTGVNPDNNAYLPEEIVGLEFSTANLLYIQMSDQTLPGTYTFTIAYYRGESIGSISFANLVVTKLEGIDAYLTDIKFSPIASEAVYPSIDITDSEYNEITQIYNPAVYFFGIDYDGADLANYQYFSINGQVNNIPLESYYPYMLDYLPLGATVARYDETRSDWASNGYYSPEVNASSTDEELKVLAADFTQVATINGTEQNVPILYRISSEGEISEGVKSEVFYFITVNDVTYNLTLSFDVYYCDDNDFCVLANTTTEFTEVIQLNSYNLYIHSNDVVYTTPLPDENNPLYYPVFDRISGLYNSMTHFIYTDSTNINYRFGRNRSGFYIFEVILPRDEYLNEMYTYEIEFDEYLLNDINAVDFPPFESDVSYNGKYYFIMPSEVNRTRKFNIYIYRVDVSEDKPFGLFDIFRTWG